MPFGFAKLHPVGILGLAPHSFTEMIRRRYEDESIRILVSEEEILFKNEALLDVLTGEGEKEKAVS